MAVTDPQAVPGLDSGSVYYVGTRFVVWAAEGRGGGGSSTSSTRDGVTGNGSISLTGGQKVTFQFAIPVGQSGTATVNGTEYELSRGRLFLVRPAGGGLEVKQVEADLAGVNLGTADMAALGREHPAIRAFFEPGK